VDLALEPLLLLLEPVPLATDFLEPPTAGLDAGVLGTEGSRDHERKKQEEEQGFPSTHA
jgi:hypothetical protein